MVVIDISAPDDAVCSDCENYNGEEGVCMLDWIPNSPFIPACEHFEPKEGQSMETDYFKKCPYLKDGICHACRSLSIKCDGEKYFACEQYLNGRMPYI